MLLESNSFIFSLSNKKLSMKLTLIDVSWRKSMEINEIWWYLTSKDDIKRQKSSINVKQRQYSSKFVNICQKLFLNKKIKLINIVFLRKSNFFICLNNFWRILALIDVNWWFLTFDDKRRYLMLIWYQMMSIFWRKLTCSSKNIKKYQKLIDILKKYIKT